MKNYTNIFKISFIFYTLFVFANKYITAQTWADIIFCLFICSVLFQLLYLIYLRKKENRKLLNSIGLYFVCSISSISISMIINYIKLFLFGYTPTDWVGNSLHVTYYGFTALKENTWNNIICLPWLIINIIIIIIYCINKVRKKGVDPNG